MTIYELKPRFQALLRPLCNVLARHRCTANQVTVLAMVLSIGVGVGMALAPDSRAMALLIPLTLFVRMALNAIDGMLAREHGQQSALGGILNELGDVISDAALYLPFALIPGVSRELVIAVVLLAILSEMTGVVVVQVGASRRYDGPMGKSDRAFVFGLIALAIGLGVAPLGWVNIVLAAIAVLTIATMVNRSAKALQEIR